MRAYVCCDCGSRGDSALLLTLACVPGAPLSAPVELALAPASARPPHSSPAGRYQERPCRARTQVSRDGAIQQERDHGGGVERHGEEEKSFITPISISLSVQSQPTGGKASIHQFLYALKRPSFPWNAGNSKRRGFFLDLHASQV